jgi:hypothetical protein
MVYLLNVGYKWSCYRLSNWSSKITHGFENSKFFLVIFLLRGLWVHGFMSLRVEGLKGLRVV